VLEGAEGFMHAYAGSGDAETLLAGLGTTFRLLESGFKPHAACRYAHGPIDCAARLMREQRFQAEHVETIEVYLSELANRQSNFYEPASVASAQGSTPFVIAASVVLGSESLSVADVKQAFDDARVWGLHRRVKLHVDSTMDYMGRGCRIGVELRDGRRFDDAVELPRGEPENPLTDSEIERKFTRQAAVVLGESRAHAIRKSLSGLEALERVDAVMKLTAAESDAGGVKA
jgi:2-methylcitrate dehydratase PrpD